MMVQKSCCGIYSRLCCGSRVGAKYQVKLVMARRIGNWKEPGNLEMLANL